MVLQVNPGEKKLQILKTLGESVTPRMLPLNNTIITLTVKNTLTCILLCLLNVAYYSISLSSNFSNYILHCPLDNVNTLFWKVIVLVVT